MYSQSLNTINTSNKKINIFCKTKSDFFKTYLLENVLCYKSQGVFMNIYCQPLG